MKLNQRIKEIVESKISDIHTCLPAKIEDYNHETMYAKVVILAKKEFEGEMEELTPVIDVPVSHIKAGNFIVRPPYEKDDVVLVAFSEAGLDKLLITGEPEDPQFSRRFAYDDAIVLQGLKVEQEDDYPTEEADGLYIANLEQNNKFIMESGGDIKLINEAVEGGEKIPTKYAEILVDAGKNIELNRVDPDTDTNTQIHVESSGKITVTNVTAQTSITVEADGVINVSGMKDINVETEGNINLQGGNFPVARQGDDVQVEVTSGSSAGTYTGEITSGSNSVNSG